MNDTSTSMVERVLGTIDDADFRVLLDSANVTASGLQQLILRDLQTGRQARLDPDLDSVALHAMTEALFAAGDGAAVRNALQDADGQCVLALVRGAQVLLCGRPDRALALAGGSRLDLNRLRAVAAEVAGPLAAGDFAAVLAASPPVEAVWRFDPANGRVVEEVMRPGCSGLSRLGAGEFQGQVGPLLTGFAGQPVGGAAVPDWLDGALLVTAQNQYEWCRVPFAPRLVLALQSSPQSGRQIFREARAQAHEILRQLIGRVLGGGLETQVQPFPQTETEFNAIVAELRALDSDDLAGRLDIGGFADHPIDGEDGPMRCQECIYFLPKRRWCDLPELPLPVEPEWYCRLWKL